MPRYVKADEPGEGSLWNSKEEVANFADYIWRECERLRSENADWVAAPIFDLLLHIEAVSQPWMDRIIKDRDARLHAQGDAIVGPPYEADPRQ